MGLSSWHEVLLALIRLQPRLVVELLAALGVAVPDGVDRVTEGPNEFTDLTQFHWDAAGLLVDPDERPLLAVIVEVQRSDNKDKARSWPLYVAAG